MKDDIGDHLKMLEEEQDARFDDTLYIRIDGRSFSKFTKHLEYPYDDNLRAVFYNVTKHLAEEFNAVCAYTQSDEISLVLKKATPDSELPFGGRRAKLTSISAAMATTYFVRYASMFWPELVEEQPPMFDARVIPVTDEEALMAIKWRWQDAKRNAVQMLARHLFSHKQCQNKSTKDLIAMLKEDGVSLNDYPMDFEHGVVFIKDYRMVDPKDLGDIPEKYRPTEPVKRRFYNGDVVGAFGFSKVLCKIEEQLKEMNDGTYRF